MKKKNGFTLVEIIIVIILIALVAIMFTNSFYSINRNNREKEYTQLINKVKNAVTVYANDGEINDLLYGTEGYALVTIDTLVKGGYLDKDLYDPTTQKSIEYSNIVYVVADQYGVLNIEYPHTNSGSSECYLETTPLKVSKSIAINDDLYFSNLNYVGLRVIKTDGTVYSLTKNVTIEVINSNILSGSSGTYTINYRYKDCNNNSFWRIGKRKVILY